MVVPVLDLRVERVDLGLECSARIREIRNAVCGLEADQIRQ
jgi:hypothetical protein